MILNSFSRYLFLLLFTFSFGMAQGQSNMFQAPDTFNQKRFWFATGTAATVYTASVIGLSELWYSQYDRGKFHLFNDWKEWEGVDKAGHTYTTYFETTWAFEVFRWTGMKRKKAMWAAAGAGTLFQTTVEVLDGFSDKWGFSLGDVAFNTLGTGLFVFQELAWQEQRILIKVSSSHPKYPNYRITSDDGSSEMFLQQRVDDLYGISPVARFVKDYNAQNTWMSFNVASFLKNENRFPKWLNVAVGYGADNMFGGFENQWIYEDKSYTLSTTDFVRQRQFYLSFDVDLKRIKTKSKLLKALLGAFNVWKIPSPTLELNTQNGLKFHAIYF